mmetsp:Transcript_66921/g.139487  ORF Transcript_66921/g.139487 Transcript_66921/m.139487 type:complete len:298 (+) Transcript_66921:120-1013(+)|eukprot:CAMPEP_0181294866 /NCGR_PEP_ID=MMETSP1101-20121128/3835_1 /TAXON_ID=46948 /ORGANISM="Rhodomonas abbreviata, Strain Caron Lab Isolate" /LENGTH=297 /DNA_ID=CAMNT_0023399565 /DNA_START=112 /DNA_END=1005 /DNA_ORIENTATION=+
MAQSFIGFDFGQVASQVVLDTQQQLDQLVKSTQGIVLGKDTSVSENHLKDDDLAKLVQVGQTKNAIFDSAPITKSNPSSLPTGKAKSHFVNTTVGAFEDSVSPSSSMQSPKERLSKAPTPSGLSSPSSPTAKRGTSDPITKWRDDLVKTGSFNNSKGSLGRTGSFNRSSTGLDPNKIRACMRTSDYREKAEYEKMLEKGMAYEDIEKELEAEIEKKNVVLTVKLKAHDKKSQEVRTTRRVGGQSAEEHQSNMNKQLILSEDEERIASRKLDIAKRNLDQFRQMVKSGSAVVGHSKSA